MKRKGMYMFRATMQLNVKKCTKMTRGKKSTHSGQKEHLSPQCAEKVLAAHAHFCSCCAQVFLAARGAALSYKQHAVSDGFGGPTATCKSTRASDFIKRMSAAIP